MEQHINLFIKYENSPVIRGLVQPIPCSIGSSIDTK